MNNLATQNQNDITITETGEAFISQRKLEELLGLGTGTISKYISRQHPEATTDKGLSAEMVETVSVYYAFDTANPNEKAKEFAKMLMKAGAKAYLYHEAGYTMKAEKPMTQLELMAQSVQTLINHEKQLAEQAQRLSAVEARLDFKEEHISVGLFLSRRGYKLTSQQLSPLGKLMTQVTTLRNLPTGLEKAGRYDVKTYPEWLLLETLNAKYPDLTK